MGRGRWDKRNGVQEIVEKPTILTVIVMMNLGIAFLMKHRIRLLKCIKTPFSRGSDTEGAIEAMLWCR